MPNGLLDSMSLKLVPGVKVIPEALVMADLKELDLTISGLDKILQKVEVSEKKKMFLFRC